MEFTHKTPNGQICFCNLHNCYHLEFGNIFLHLSYDELEKMRDYVSSIDYLFYLEKNKNSPTRRKLLLNIGSLKIYLCLDPTEFIELRELLSLKKKPAILKNREVIGTNLIYN